MMRPFPLEVTAGDFAFATDHRRYRHQLRGRHLETLRWSPEILTRDDGRLNTVRSGAVLSLSRNGNRHSPTLAALKPA
jgi:hypothetical protein